MGLSIYITAGRCGRFKLLEVIYMFDYPARSTDNFFMNHVRVSIYWRPNDNRTIGMYANRQGFAPAADKFAGNYLLSISNTKERELHQLLRILYG